MTAASKTLLATGLLMLAVGLALGKGQGEAHSASNIASMVLLPLGVLDLMTAAVVTLMRRRSTDRSPR